MVIVIVYSALRLSANDIQEAMNYGFLWRYAHIMKMCHEYDNVGLDEAMEWTAEGGHKEVVRLYRELGAYKFDLAMLWAATSGQENMRLFNDWEVTNFEQPMVWTANNGCEMQCFYVMNREPPTLTQLWHGPRVVVTNPQFVCATIGVSKKLTWL